MIVRYSILAAAAAGGVGAVAVVGAGDYMSMGADEEGARAGIRIRIKVAILDNVGIGIGIFTLIIHAAAGIEPVAIHRKLIQLLVAGKIHKLAAGDIEAVVAPIVLNFADECAAGD